MTNDPESVDLSALDPARRPELWAGRMEATRRAVAAVLLERSRPPGPLEVLTGWARPILAAAAVLLLLLGATAALLGTPAVPRPSEARRLALLSESAVIAGRAATGAEIRTALRRRTGT